MTTRIRLLALIVLLLLACRLPYAIGRRLSSGGEMTPTGTPPAVSIGAETGTAAASAVPGGYPGPYSATGQPGEPGVDPGTLPQETAAGASPEAGTGAYPGLSPQQTTTTQGGYPATQNPDATDALPVQSGAETATPSELEAGQTPGETALPPTLIASPTPFLTPTPTLTNTPTITPTPLPPPAWSRANLRATDPRTVKLASGKVQLVEFFAFWSGPSQALSPLVQGVESEYGERVNFVYLDIDDPAVAPFEDELKFKSPPHFFLLAPDGTIIDDWVGYITLANLRAKLESALNP